MIITPVVLTVRLLRAGIRKHRNRQSAPVITARCVALANHLRTPGHEHDLCAGLLLLFSSVDLDDTGQSHPDADAWGSLYHRAMEAAEIRSDVIAGLDQSKWPLNAQIVALCAGMQPPEMHGTIPDEQTLRSLAALRGHSTSLIPNLS